MITELYPIDELLVNNLVENIVTIEVLSKSGSTWTSTAIPSEKIVSESLEIKQSICDSEELDIGGCIPSQLTLSVIDLAEDLSGKRIVVKVLTRYRSDDYVEALYPAASLYPSTTLYPSAAAPPSILSTDDYVLFVGEIDSCKKATNNYRVRKIIAFDRMYYASTVRCKNRVYKYLKGYGEAPVNFFMLFNYFESESHINIVGGTSSFINNSSIADIWTSNWSAVIDKDATFLDCYKWSCELNNVFLIEDTPKHPKSFSAEARAIKLYLNRTKYAISSYSSLTYEDFMTKDFRYVQFNFSRDNYYTYIRINPTDGFSYYISDNPLSRSIQDGTKLVKKLGSPYADGYNYETTADKGLHNDGGTNIIAGNSIYCYRPFKASIFNRWWVQVGDRVRIPTSDPEVPYVDSIILSRTIKGLYGMTVEIEAKGVEIFGKENDESI